jgi:putative ABC transport system ATP-binding protein
MNERRPAIRVSGLVKKFEKGLVPALNGVELTVSDGEWVAIVGPSGCGKSTLLHLIAALDRADEGTIAVREHELATERNLSHYRARDIGCIFQLHNLLPTLSASENVQIPMFELALPGRERHRRAERLLALVGLAGKEHSLPSELSGGERQRVAIARSLAMEPPILLADEPTGSLDSEAGRRVLDLLGEIRAQQGLTMVMVTHDPAVAERADRVVRMLDGRVVGEEAPRREEPPRTAASVGD